MGQFTGDYVTLSNYSQKENFFIETDSECSFNFTEKYGFRNSSEVIFMWSIENYESSNQREHG